jgi:hypothetical protein
MTWYQWKYQNVLCANIYIYISIYIYIYIYILCVIDPMFQNVFFLKMY